MVNKKIIIGSRSSPLAKIQTKLVISCLKKVGFEKFEIIYFKTTGDKLPSKKFKENGGKGLFTKEIDQLVINDKIDIAVHSAKDIPGKLDPRLEIGAFLSREDARDVLITNDSSIKKLSFLPKNITLGTSSPRRIAYVKKLRPDIEIMQIRGNIETRIKKVLKNDLNSIILAKAALKRLDLKYNKLNILPIPLSQIIPAPGQGAIALVYKKENKIYKSLCRSIGCKNTKIAVDAERALIKEINGDCFTPIAAHAKIKENKIILNACLFSDDTKKYVRERIIGPKSSPNKIGKKCGSVLLKRIRGRLHEKKKNSYF